MKLNLSHHLTFLCLALSSMFLFTSSATEPRTLAFICDVTFSMLVDLESIKVAMERIIKEIPNELDSYFGEYMFMPFHDPAIGFPLLTDNKNDFFKIIKMHFAMPTSRNDDCEQMALPALTAALHFVTRYSYIVVFTDDNSKHTDLVDVILNITSIQRPTISFVITPGCNFGNNDPEYERIASKTGGQIYETVKKNVSTLTYGLHEHWKTKWYELKRLDFAYGGSHEIRIAFKDLKKVLISFTGKDANVRIFAPYRREVKGNYSVDMQNIKEIILEDIESGMWTLEVSSKNHHRLRVLAIQEDVTSNAYLGLFIAYCFVFGVFLALCLYNYKFVIECFTKCWQARPSMPSCIRCK